MRFKKAHLLRFWKGLSPAVFLFGVGNTRSPPYVRTSMNARMWTLIACCAQLPTLFLFLWESQTAIKDYALPTLFLIALWQLAPLLRLKVLFSWAFLAYLLVYPYSFFWQAAILSLGTLASWFLDRKTPLFFHPIALSGLGLIFAGQHATLTPYSWPFFIALSGSTLLLSITTLISIRVVASGLIGLLLWNLFPHTGPTTLHYLCLVFFVADSPFAPSLPISQYATGFVYAFICAAFSQIPSIPIALLACEGIALYLDRIFIRLYQSTPATQKGSQYVQSHQQL